MSMDAVAALKVKLDDAKKTLKAAPGGLVGADGETIRVRALDDGILVDLGVSLRDPDAVALALRQRLGAVLDAHDDPRGVMVFPERARPSAKTYAEVVELLGDLGEWLEPSDDENLQGGPTPDLAAMMGQMLGDPSQMQGLWQQAQRMMADPAMQQQLMAAAAQMMGGIQGEDEGAPEGEGELPGLGALDFGALAAQAQALLEDDPELVRRLQEQLTGGGDEDDEDDEDDA